MSTQVKIQQSIVAHAHEGVQNIINEMDGDSIFDLSELHHRLFNEDYFIIGYYKAEQWIRENNLNAWDVIEEVKDYEELNFGTFSTELNAEAMVNMFAYIQGEALLNSLENMRFNEADKERMEAILSEIDEMLLK
jgi:hypothetical protein